MDWKPGLEGVVVAETSVSEVRGLEGELSLRGHPVAEVAAMGFEGAAELLLQRALPGLGDSRTRAFERQAAVPLRGEVMDQVRALVAGASEEDLLAEVAMAAVRASGRSTAPDPELDHATDLLRMLGGDPKLGFALGAYLATVMDHGLNASTFTARVVASTGSDTVSAVTAALGALKGPLHGGAPGPVLDMLDAAAGDPAAWVAAELEAGRRIMGLGHRVYRVRDPRAAVLEAVAEDIGAPRLPLAREVEEAAVAALSERYPGRRLRANVEFATAVLLDALGLDRRLFTALFACGRVVGWLAHIDEERAVGRIMRPRARYRPSSQRACSSSRLA